MHAPAPALRTLPGFTPRLIGYFVIITLIWGSTWLVIRGQLGPVPVAWSLAWRFLGGAAALMAMCVATGRSLRLDARGHGFALVVAVAQYVLNFNLVYRAEQYLTSGLVALCFALLIIPNAILAALFLGQRITARFALGSGMGIIGVGLMLAHDLAAPGRHGAEVALGLGLALAGVCSASVANVLQATAIGRAQPLDGGIAWAMGYGGLINAALAWISAGPPVIATAPAYLAGLAYLAILASAFVFSLYYALIRAVGPGRAAYTGVLVPLVAMALSSVFEGFQWTGLGAAGGGLALLGLVVALRGRA